MLFKYQLLNRKVSKCFPVRDKNEKVLVVMASELGISSPGQSSLTFTDVLLYHY